MGWDDEEGSGDEWDEEKIEAKLQEQQKEKEREKRREQGLDSDSEEEKPKASTPSAKPTPKPKKKVEVKSKEPEPVLSAQELKLRQRKLEEEQDARLADDLFAGVDKAKVLLQQEEAKVKAQADETARKAALKPKVVVHDAFDKIELTLQGDVEKLCLQCIEKIDKGTCKSGASKFLVDLLKSIEADLDLKEITDFEKMLAEMATQKKVSKSCDSKASKANTKLSKTTKFNAGSEWEELYGGGEGDEQWTPEEWEAWEKAQAQAKKT